MRCPIDSHFFSTNLDGAKELTFGLIDQEHIVVLILFFCSDFQIIIQKGKIMIHPGTRGLIFDLDGTLADTMGLHVSAWEIAGRHFGVDIDGSEIYKLAGIPTQPIVEIFNERYGWSLDPVAFEEKKDEAYLQVKEDAGQIKPVQRVLDIAHAHRDVLPMAVGTGSIREDAEMALSDMGITSWFRGLVTADDVERPKPDPETFVRCAEIIDIDPQYCQVFEDGPKGIEAALSAGMVALNIVTWEMHLP